jgi:hypothetical protein
MSELPLAVPLIAGGVNRDYLTIYNDLQSLIPHFTKEWTYHGEDDFGVALLQLFAYLADHLHYRADTVFRDSFLASTQDRHSLEKLAERLGYFVVRKSAAFCEVTFTLSAALAANFTIPEGTRVQASSSGSTVNDSQNIVFELKDDLIILAGTTSGVGVVYEGSTKSVTVGPALGARFETFLLPDTEILFNQGADDLEIRVNGTLVPYTKFASLVSRDSLAYTVNVLRGDFLQVVFGDGTFGARLAPGDIVTISYRAGGGRVGLVAPAAIDTLLDTLTFQGSALSIAVTNAARSIGGLEAEDDDDIRVKAPASFATQNRAVTLEDYRFYAETVAGVRKCKPLRAGINGVLLYILPDDASLDFTLTNAFISSILGVVNPVRMATDSISVQAAVMVPIDVDVECIAFESQQNSTVRRRVIQEFLEAGGILNSNNASLGQHLRLSDMIGSLEGVEGVDYLNVLRYARRSSLTWVTQTGNAVLSSTGVQINKDTVPETYIITFISATTFSVKGSVSGPGSGVGTIDAAYGFNVGGRELASFQISAGTVATARGDRAKIIVSELASNIQLSEGEFPIAGTITVAVSGGIE